MMPVKVPLAAATFAILILAVAAYAQLAPNKSMPLPSTPGAFISNDLNTSCQPRPRLYDLDEPAYRRQAKAVFATYRIPYSEHRNYELDHLIPRCLGGSDTTANLWPQPLAEAKHKNETEREICRQVCDTRTMSLQQGRALFITGKW